MTGRLALQIGEFQVKPDRIQAVRLTRENVEHAANWCGGRVGEEPKSSDPTDVYTYLIVPTIDGNVSVNIGDWVIRFHNKGSFAGMTNENFQRKYQQVGSYGDNPFPRERTRGFVSDIPDEDVSPEGSIPEPSGHIRDDFEMPTARRGGIIFGRRNVPSSRRPDYDDSVAQPSRVRDGDDLDFLGDNLSGGTNLGYTRGS